MFNIIIFLLITLSFDSYAAMNGVLERDYTKEMTNSFDDGIKKNKDLMNYTSALSLARDGNYHAQYILGVSYNLGKLSLRVDHAKSFLWLKKSADQHFPLAEYALGMMYYFGNSFVASDYAKSYSYLLRSFRHGYNEAAFIIGYFYDNGILFDENNKVAADWYTKAANKYSERAALSLADMFFNGEGVSQNINKAYFYTMIAAKLRNKKAINISNKFKRGSLCHNNAKVKLFGLLLKCTSRKYVRLRVIDDGVTGFKHNDNNAYDQYSSVPYIVGSKSLIFGYTRDGQFSESLITFSSISNLNVYINFLNNEYGPSIVSSVVVNGISTLARWSTGDNIDIYVAKDEEQSFIYYVSPVNYVSMKNSLN